MPNNNCTRRAGRNAVQEWMAQVEALIARIDQLVGSAAREDVQQVVKIVMDIHCHGLKRIIRCLKQRDPDNAVLDALASDELVGNLLLLHGLHPSSMEQRVRGAVASVRTYLQSHGSDIELVGVSPGAVDIRIKANCDGCVALADSIKLVARNAVCDAAPEVGAVNIQLEQQRATVQQD